MARPPIIISNGGVISELTKGVWNAPDIDKAEQRLLKNVKDLKDKTIIKIIQTKKNKEAYCLYWRLISEAQYEDAEDQKGIKKFNDGKERISINDLLDPYL